MGEPGRRGRPPRHTSAQIVATASRLADRDGIEAVTMRRVAAELGAGAASLYSYVPTRDDLLDRMHDAVAEEYVLEPLTGDWLADVLAVAMQTRALLLRHPWAVALMESRPSTGPGWLDVLEHVLDALAARPVDDAAKLEAYGAVNAVVLSYVRSETTGHEMAERTVDRLSRAAADGRHPHIAALRLTPSTPGSDPLRRTLAGILAGLLDHPERTE